MADIKYIMVTNWSSHWDRLLSRYGENSATYSLKLIDDDVIDKGFPNKAVTLFIRLDEVGKFKKSWIGTTRNFREEVNNGQPIIKFDVTELQEISRPSLSISYHPGWYLNKENISSKGVIIADDIEPGFFKKMENCSWDVFERHSFQLLRLIGIHDIHTLPLDAQQGKADGFFCFQSLAVIYDASLASNFVDRKAQQIENYINQLKREKLDFSDYSLTIKDMQKQVWIITRGKAVNLLKAVDHIKVKEIPYSSLIGLYNKRLTNEIGSSEFEDILKNL